MNQGRAGSGKIASLLQEAPALLAGGQSNVLEARIAGFTTDIVEQTPWLLYYLGACKSQYNLAEARTNFERAFHLFLNDKDTTGIVLSWCGIVDSIAYEWNDLRPIDRWVKWYDENLGDTLPVPFPVPEIEAKLVSTMVNVVTFRLPVHPDCEKWLKRAYVVLEDDGDININMRIMLGANLVAYYCFSRGDSHRTNQLVDYLKKLSVLPGVSPFTVLFTSLPEAIYLWLVKVDTVACLDVVSKALKLSDRMGMHYFDHYFFAQAAQAALTAGDTALAAEYLGKMNAVIKGINRMDASNYHYLSAWRALLNGDMLEALQHSRNCLTLTEEVTSPLVSVYGHFGISQALFELGQYKQAIGHLDTAIDIGHECNAEGAEAMGHIFKAYLLLEKGENAGGLEHLAKGYALLKKSGFMNFPYWRPSMMSGLCVRALNAGIETEFAKFLITKRGLMPDTPPYHCENWPWQIKIKALGKLKVLREDKAVRLTGKTLGKPVEMLEAILAHGGRDVKAETVMDMLWPDSEGDNAHKAFDTTLHRLRKFLGGNDTVVLKDGKVGLNELICYLDIWAVEHLMEKAEDLLRREKIEGCESETCCVLDKALSLFKGPFLEGTKMPQAFDRIQNRFFRLAEWVGDNYEKSERILESVELYRKIIETGVATEEFYRRLMASYKRLGRDSDVLATYKRCRDALLASFGIEPSRETEAIYRSVLTGANKPSLP